MGFFGKNTESNGQMENKAIKTNTSNTNSEITNKLKEQIQQELAVANATELVNKASENCFEMCLMKPYDKNNDVCVDQCLAKYLRSWNVISKTYISRIKDASNNGEI